MTKRKPLTQQKLASEEENEVEGESRRRKASKNSRNEEFIVPPMNQKFVSCLQLGMNLNLLEKGADSSLQFQGTVAGQLTQQIYELIRSQELSVSNLERCHKWKGESSEIEYLYLCSRYFVSEKDNMVCDRKREDRIVCEPASMFHLVMCSHLLNNHVTSYNIHRNLVKTYANITRDYIVTAISYCSKCNPELKAKPFQKKRHKNVYWKLLPLERVHVEIFEPFDGEKIQGRFSHVFYCRDYFSRYVWILPLQNDKRKHIIRALSTFLLSLPRIPIFLESTTITREFLFDLCGQIAQSYSLKLGLGVKNSQRFHNTGIKDIKELLAPHKDECLEDWNSCLKYGPFHINQNINVSSDGRPGDLLFTSVPDCNRKFVKKRNEVVLDTPSQYVVNLGEGTLFLENSTEENKGSGANDEDTNLNIQDQENDQDSDQVEKEKSDEKSGLHGKLGLDANFPSNELAQQGENEAENDGPNKELDVDHLSDEQILESIEKNVENSPSEPKGSVSQAEKTTISMDSHVNIVPRSRIMTADDYIYDSDELANYDLEVEQARQEENRKFKGKNDISKPKSRESSLKTKKKRKLFGKKLQPSASMDESIEL